MSDQKVYVIGSAPDCDIVVDDPHVSGHHCKLHFDRGGFLLEDLQSTNGTYVNGVRISEATIITKGERVTLGRKSPMPWPGANDAGSGGSPPASTPPPSTAPATPEPKSEEPKPAAASPVPAPAPTTPAKSTPPSPPPEPAAPTPPPQPIAAAAAPPSPPSETVPTPPPASARTSPDAPAGGPAKKTPPIPADAPSPPPSAPKPPPAKSLPPAPKSAIPKAPASKTPPAKSPPKAAPPKGAPVPKTNTPPEIKQRPPASPARPSPRFTDPFALDPDGNPKQGNTMLLAGAGVAVAALIGLLVWAFTRPGPDEDPPPKPANGAQQDGTKGIVGREGLVWLGYELNGADKPYATGFAIASDLVLTSAEHASWIGGDGAVALVGNDQASVRVSKFEVVEIPGTESRLLLVTIPELTSLKPLKTGAPQPPEGTPIEILTWDEWNGTSTPRVVAISNKAGAEGGTGFAVAFDKNEAKYKGAAVLADGALVGMLDIGRDGSAIVLPIPEKLP